MFSKKTANRKLNRKKKVRPNHGPGKDTVESLRDREHKLNAQIGELEEILASREREEVRQKAMRQDNILPPPEYGSQDRRGTDIMAYPERRRNESDRKSGSLYFFVLLAIASALAFWLFYTGG